MAATREICFVGVSAASRPALASCVGVSIVNLVSVQAVPRVRAKYLSSQLSILVMDTVTLLVTKRVTKLN